VELIILPTPLRLCCAWLWHLDAGLLAFAAGVGTDNGRAETMLTSSGVIHELAFASLQLFLGAVHGPNSLFVKNLRYQIDMLKVGCNNMVRSRETRPHNIVPHMHA
jgi:hypothetical protein